MRLAILFWFYKDLGLCKNRLRLLRLLNPGVPIYGLYGGDPQDAASMRAVLGPWCDDLYAFPEPRTPEWKWLNGDHLIAAWHKARGHALPDWDTLIVVQWDMLVLAPVRDLFAFLRPGELLLSGLRPLAEVEAWWGWAGRRLPERRPALDAFQSWLAQRHGYSGELWCCQFMVAALPRRFLDQSVADGPTEDGFIEYRVPTLARVYGIPFRLDHPFRPWWGADPATRDAPPPARILNAMGEAVPLALIRDQLADPHGGRIFHPFGDPFAEAELL